MKIVSFLKIACLLFCSMIFAQRDPVLGKWKCIDDESGKPVAIIEIFQEKNEFFAKVIDIVNPKNKDFVCSKCPGEYKDKPALGLVILRNLKKKNNEYSGGEILDVKQGKFYKCYLNFHSDDVLKVRGYLGISLFGRTQYWYRVD